MKQRPPAKILALAGSVPAARGATSLPSSADPSTPATPAANATPPNKNATSAPVDFAKFADGVTLEDAVRRLQRQLAAHQEALEDSMTKGADESTIQLKQRNVNVTIDLLRKCESTLDEQRKGRGELIDLADVQEDWGMLLRSLASMRDRMPDDIEQELAAVRDSTGVPLAFTPAQLTALRTAVSAVRLREDELLRTAKHWANLAPSPPSPDAERPAA